MDAGEPPPLDYATPSPTPPARPWRSFAVAALCLITACLVGALTNFVGGSLSRPYFTIILRGPNGPPMSVGDIVRHGIFESTCAGLGFAGVFTLVYVAYTFTRLPLLNVVRVLALCVAMSLVFWAVGGAFGLFLAAISPSDFQAWFPPSRFVNGQALFRWGFVGGSIWGLYVGSIASLFFAAILLSRDWTLYLRAYEARYAGRD